MQASLERLRRRRQEIGDEGGFTLIELLIVIVILGILAAIVVFAVQNLTSSSAQASCGSDYKTVQTAVEAYKAQMDDYPAGVGSPGGTVLTDTSASTVNAASAGVILLAPAGTGTNDPAPTPGAAGPWLKDVPANGTHYTIIVSNDGKGTVSVSPPGTPTNPCANAS